MRNVSSEVRETREWKIHLRLQTVENAAETRGPQLRTYGCAKCGAPFTAYPPDDVHNTSSRESSSFLEKFETVHPCSKCNEVTRLYWGRPVFYLGIAVGLRRLYSLTILVAQRLLGTLLRVRVGKSQDKDEGQEIPQEYSDSAENIDDEIYEYISSNGGAIAVRKAAEDLRIPAEVIKEAIERMATEGRLKPQPDLM
jgi:hypothetical protein